MTSERGEQLFGVGDELAFRRVLEVFLQMLFRVLLLPCLAWTAASW
jgi:hypothetical protein